MLLLTIILAAVVLVARFIDFLLGAQGRRRLKDFVLVEPWTYLSNRSLSALLARGAASFERLAVALFGPDLFRSRAIFFIAITWAIPLNLTLFRLAPRVLRIEPHPFDLLANLSARDFYSGYFEEVSSIVSFAAGTLAIASLRQTARRLAGSARLLEQLGLLVKGFALLAGLALMLELPGLVYVVRTVPPMFLIVGDRMKLHLLWFNAILFGTIPALATLAFVALIFAPVALEGARRFVTLLIERLDEDNRSPLGVLSAGLAAVIAILTLLIKACSSSPAAPGG